MSLPRFVVLVALALLALFLLREIANGVHGMQRLIAHAVEVEK